MADFPATGRWTIYSVQKTLPIIGRIGALFGAHNYLALIDPDGHIDSEMHGVYTGEDFVANGPVAGNYLQVRMYREDGYMAPQSVLSARPVFFGREEDMRRILHTGYREVAKSLDHARILYDGAEIFGHAVNSNSVWYTALRAMGVEDPSQTLLSTASSRRRSTCHRRRKFRRKNPTCPIRLRMTSTRLSRRNRRNCASGYRKLRLF